MIGETKDRLIFVNIKKSYEAMKNGDRNNPFYRENLHECTRKYWRIAEDKADVATHILGCYQGIVLYVIRIDSVSTVSSGELCGRKVFEGPVEPNSSYLGMDLHELFGTLANFNTRYWNL